MKRLYGFKNWLIQTFLQSEATLRFGQKFINKDVNEVPPGYWSWLLTTMDQQPSWTPAIEDNGKMLNRNQVIQLANHRANNKNHNVSVAPANKATWVLAKVIDVPNLNPGEHVVLTKVGDDWNLMTRTGKTQKISANQIKSSVSSVRDSSNNPIQSVDPEELWKQVPEEPVKKGGNPHILSPEQLKEEQRNIDSRFEQMMSSKTQDHMMINALAGTGKTTILKHLAWKYGKPGQKWLYLVFNTKNRVEAEEVKDGYRKFPDFVEVYTTNSFLGHLLGHKKNLGRIPQTELMVKLGKTGEKSGKKEKIREIVDYNPQFQKMLLNYGLPMPNVITSDVLERYGISDRDQKYYTGALKGILTSIRFQFKERVIKLTGLLKSFGINPEKPDLESEVNRVFNKYDVAVHDDEHQESGYFDTDLEDVKERIENYKPTFKAVILKVLKQILGYDFMEKNFKDEIIESATWLLHTSLPHAVDQKYIHGYGDAATEYNLGEFRDFSDDLWYSAIYSDKLHWDKYDVVLADEVQDFNAGQMIMLKKLHDAGAKIVAVGDPNQAIYRFRGADNDAFKNLSNMLGDLSSNKKDWAEMPLSRNFRSRENILDFANNRTHVKNLIAGKKFADNDKGSVTDGDIKYDEVFDTLKKEHTNKNIRETAFLARTNEPLVHAALKLLSGGIPFVIIGKDIAGDLIRHIMHVVKSQNLQDNAPVEVLKDALIHHHESERDKNEGKATKKDYLSELSDTTMALTASIDSFLGKDTENSRPDPSKTIAVFKKWIEAKLNGLDVQENESDLKNYKAKVEKEHPVVLTTAHKSKGLEFSRVYILRSDQFPHPRAKHPEEQEQEKNAEYVAYTRAMDQLHIVKLDGQPGYKDN